MGYVAINKGNPVTVRSRSNSSTIIGKLNTKEVFISEYEDDGGMNIRFKSSSGDMKKGYINPRDGYPNSPLAYMTSLKSIKIYESRTNNSIYLSGSYRIFKLIRPASMYFPDGSLAYYLDPGYHIACNYEGEAGATKNAILVKGISPDGKRYHKTTSKKNGFLDLGFDKGSALSKITIQIV